MTASSSLRIEVRNVQRKLRVALPELQLFAEAALRESLRRFPARRRKVERIDEILAVLVSDRRIAELHRRFMNIAGATDVITFQHGEIFVSVETAAANAKRYRTTTDAELRLYVVHGVLHLLGFDDTNDRAAELMRKTQLTILKAASAVTEKRRHGLK
ncbi:MAG: rRNA maturation RNase YbeY [Chthoniobacterales bacterium]